jgi:hypothetical protein
MFEHRTGIVALEVLVSLFASTAFPATALRAGARTVGLWLAASALPAAVFNPFDWSGFIDMFEVLASFLAPVMVFYALYALSAQWLRRPAGGDDAYRPSESPPGALDDVRVNPGTGLPCYGGSAVDISGRGLGQTYDD